MIRTSSHNVSKYANKEKLASLDMLFIAYKQDLTTYINYIIDGTFPLSKNLSSKLLPSEEINHSRYKQLIYKQASEIVRSQLKQTSQARYASYQKVYTYFKRRERQVNFTSKKFSELNMKDLLKYRHFTVPVIKDLTISLDERFFDIKESSSFDGFVKIILPFFNEKGTRALQVKVPLVHHKHSRGFISNDFELRKVIQLKKKGGIMMMNLVWEKESKLLPTGRSLGIDVGYRQLIATSDGQVIGKEMTDMYKKVITKKKNSKSYRKALLERDNLIRMYVNQIDFDGVGTICVEDLCNVKYKSNYFHKVNDLMARWTYRPLLDRIEMTCEAKGIFLVKVSPAYTSQACSSCGHICKESRNGDHFACVSCGYEIDADINAAINIRNRGAIVPLCKKGVNDDIYLKR